MTAQGFSLAAFFPHIAQRSPAGVFPPNRRLQPKRPACCGRFLFLEAMTHRLQRVLDMAVPHQHLVQRITYYLAMGGLFNPELAEHDAVRDLLIECREELQRRRTRRTRTARHK